MRYTHETMPQTILVSRRVIEETVSRLAAEIANDYQGKNLVAVGVLKGAFIFMADLVRQINMPLEIDFITVSSYNDGTESSGTITVHQDITTDVKGKDVLVIEDILDTGYTLCFLLEHLKVRGARNVRLCALADKPSRRTHNVAIDYLGFTVPDRFIVGYGLDYDNRFRYLPDMYALEEYDDNC